MRTLELTKEILEIFTMAVTIPFGIYRLCQIHKMMVRQEEARKATTY